MTLFVHLSRPIKELSFRYREGAPLILHREPVQFGVVPESKYSLMNTSSPLTPALLPAHGLRVLAGGGGGVFPKMQTHYHANWSCKSCKRCSVSQRLWVAGGAVPSWERSRYVRMGKAGPEREEKIGKGTDASEENCLTVQGLREALR